MSAATNDAALGPGLDPTVTLRGVHELSLCRAIAGAVTEHAAGRQVERVRLRIGHFRQVVPDTLVHCWAIQTDRTDLAGAELEIEAVPAVVECAACGASTTLSLPVLRCEACDATDVSLVSGEEFLIESIDVRDRDPVAEEVP